MSDDNGNGRVKEAVQDQCIEQMASDISEIKTDLKAFIQGTAAVRVQCSNEFGKTDTNIKNLWVVVGIILAAIVGLIVL